MDINQAQSVVIQLLELEKQKKGYGDTYAMINKQVEHILPHSDTDYLPLRLINNRAPNATDEQVKYIKDNWKATTVPVFQELLTVINRGFIDDNWNILWGEDADDFKKYCDEDFPEYGSTETLIKEITPPIKYTDSNALVAVRPRGFNYVKDERGEYVVNENGGYILDDTKRVEPAVYFHPSDKVLIRNEEYYLVVSNELSVVEYNGKMVKEGRILYIYTKYDIYKVEQIGKKIDNTYRTSLYYNHNEGVIPAIEVGGVPKKTRDGGLMQVSPFRYATDLLDLALTNKNWLQLSVSTVVFPFRIMMADPCTYANDKGQCRNGIFSDKSNGMSLGSCPNCNGSGNNVPYSPLGVYLWDKDDAEKSNTNLKPVEFVEAPVTSIKFVDELVSKDTLAAKEIMHIGKSNTQVKGSENTTATGMVLNDQGQISFVRYNVHQIFNLWDWILKRVSFQRYEDYKQVPTLVYPQTFDFRSEADIWEQIKLARESEAPVSIIQDLFKSLMNNIHSSSPKAQKIYDTIVNADKLFALSDIALASRKASGTVANWEVTLHDSSSQLVNQLIRDDERYLELELQERIDKLVELAKSSTFTETSNNPVELIVNGG
jgi:hypothetical protein